MLSRTWLHIRRLWPDWRVVTPLPFVVYALVMLARGEFRWDHAAVLVGVPALAYFNELTKKLYIGAYPIGLVGLLYDSMRYVKDLGVTPSRLHICDLRDIDMSIASVVMNGQRVPVHDWLQAHASPALDLYFAIPYGTFIFVSFGFAGYLYRKDFARMQRFTWAFFAMNVAAFVTYHVYPAAPPWYVHANGCGVELATHAFEGPNLARVDQMLGFSYFGGMYGRSSDVFGAVPSLHVAYPLLIVLEGWSVFRLGWRIASFVFFVSMCIAAVYLDHHWIIDVILGLGYGLAAFAAGRIASAWRRRVRALANGLAPASMPEQSPGQ